MPTKFSSKQIIESSKQIISTLISNSLFVNYSIIKFNINREPRTSYFPGLSGKIESSRRKSVANMHVFLCWISPFLQPDQYTTVRVQTSRDSADTPSEMKTRVIPPLGWSNPAKLDPKLCENGPSSSSLMFAIFHFTFFISFSFSFCFFCFYWLTGRQSS